MADSGYNPDVLTCLANLSSDEVFTPPALANQILDMLPGDLWCNKDARFLDPGCKSGVFLREIARRLDAGLTAVIPNKQERLNHILKNQLFGLAITEITALMSRRSVYCSRLANGKYSICENFDSDDGNIRYGAVAHTWENGRCLYCGASELDYKRDNGLEAHAYEFIHTDNAQSIFQMKFDVIIGNPPYQLSDGGHGRSASPIYQLFVEQAKKLNPRYLTMIIPARWFGGGKGLGDFRAAMLADDRVRKLVDFENVKEVFPGVDLAGGVCYFLWDRDSRGPCEVTNVNAGTQVVETRKLDEFPTFVRHSGSVPIIRKVLAKKSEARMSSQVTSRKPFGLATNVRPQKVGELTLRWEKGEGPYPRDEIETGKDLIEKWKVITSYVGYDHAGNPGKDGRRRVLSKIDILPPKSICTETYLVAGAYKTQKEALNLIAYMKTRFFRFLMAQFMYSHHLTRSAYEFVPVLDMQEEWTDAMLAKRYGLTKDEIAFIASKIRAYDSAEQGDE
ncbi:restriction endonuclease [Xanthomonas citri]|uniref:Eco57I restriction-modification methylase domain-containing protein n=1 Tax=Xanthomonas citri TaxID=346 RepID=UPI001884CA76|nr:Eco57I restriction-modification methylase domain-containing protein [Xanthomonas citri]QOY20933.1 restriction endonuclease [Xanthomonas citri]QQK67060.1 restriction endonuclease [Xanthomonas citri]